MKGTNVILDFSGGSALVAGQRQLFEGLARNFPDQTIVLSTSGKVGDRDVPVINFLVTLRRGPVEQLQPVAV